VLRKYHKSAEIAFLYRKAALRSYSRGHDPLLIDLRENGDWTDEKAVARSSSAGGVGGWTLGGS
jgi:hypothetical protein